MNKYIFTFIVALFLCCACTEDFSVDPTIMPPATATGENTFGCLMDGWIYTGGRFSKPNALYIPTYEDNDNEVIRIKAEVDDGVYISFFILNPSESQTTTYIEAEYHEWPKESKELPDGTVHITRFDKQEHIISGTFQGGNIREGRFDIMFE